MRRRGGFKSRFKKTRYSNETSTFNIASEVAQNSSATFPVKDGKNGKILIDAAQIQGTRKVKNMALSISCVSPCPFPILCALVYVPQGTNAKDIGNL